MLSMSSKTAEVMSIQVPLLPPERSRLDSVCGPGAKSKRGQWVREAILEKLEREGVLEPAEQKGA